MKALLIIFAVLAVLIIAICSLSATITLVYDKGWQTKLQILFIEKDIILSEVLSFLLFPDKKGKEAAEKKNNEKVEQSSNESNPENKVDSVDNSVENLTPEEFEKLVKSYENAKDADNSSTEETNETVDENKQQPAENKPAKSNPLKKLWDNEGVLGILELLTNVLDTANSAILTLIRGLHIYSLYVMIIVGGWDAADIGEKYGDLCRYYYPLKGILLNQLRIDEYDDYIQPDFLAEVNEYEFQLIASISVGLLLKVGIKAVSVFLKNFFAAKKQSKKVK